MAQIDFTVALLSAARSRGFIVVSKPLALRVWSDSSRVLPLVDLFLYDFKETDPGRHAEFTGQTNKLILQNLRFLHDAGARIQLQCPIVPGFNDREDHFAGIAALSRSLPGLTGVQLLPYHPLGKEQARTFWIETLRPMWAINRFVSISSKVGYTGSANKEYLC